MKDLDENFITDQATMSKTLMRLIRECCELMDDMGFGDTTFGTKSWTVDFKRTDEFKDLN